MRLLFITLSALAIGASTLHPDSGTAAFLILMGLLLFVLGMLYIDEAPEKDLDA